MSRLYSIGCSNALENDGRKSDGIECCDLETFSRGFWFYSMKPAWQVEDYPKVAQGYNSKQYIYPSDPHLPGG
jgi:hypothetical protein